MNKALGSHPQWVLIGIYLILGFLWALLIPPFEKPDEIHHFAYVQFVMQERKIPKISADNPVFLRWEVFQPPLYYFGGALVYRIGVLFGLSETNLDAWFPRINTNFLKDNSKANLSFFYHFESLTHPQGSFPYDLILIRLFSLFLGGVTLIFIYKTALLAFRGEIWLAVLTAGIIAFMPQFTFITSSVSNDVLASTLGAISIFQLHRLGKATSGKYYWDYFLLGLVMGLGFMTKNYFFSLLPLVLFSALVFDKNTLLRRFQGLLIFSATLLFVSGWWFLRNFLLYQNVLGNFWEISAFYSSQVAPRSLFSPYFFSHAPIFWISLGESLIGRFGFLHIAMPTIYYKLFLWLLLASLVGIIIYFIRRNRSLIELNPLVFNLLVVFMAITQSIYFNLSVSSAQGRHVFYALSSIGIVFVTGLSSLFSAFWERILSMTGKSPPGVIPSRDPILMILSVLAAINLYALFIVVLPQY